MAKKPATKKKKGRLVEFVRGFDNEEIIGIRITSEHFAQSLRYHHLYYVSYFFKTKLLRIGCLEKTLSEWEREKKDGRLAERWNVAGTELQRYIYIHGWIKKNVEKFQRALAAKDVFYLPPPPVKKRAAKKITRKPARRTQ